MSREGTGDPAWRDGPTPRDAVCYNARPAVASARSPLPARGPMPAIEYLADRFDAGKTVAEMLRKRFN